MFSYNITESVMTAAIELKWRENMSTRRSEELTALERVALTLQHKEADRIPVYPLLNGISRKLVNASYKEWALNADVTAEAYCRVTERFGLDVIVTLTDLSVEAGDFG